MECDGIDIVVGVRVEGEIECSVCIESRDTIACDSSYGRKSSSDKDFSICLDGDGSHLVSSCDSDVGIPSSIQCSICIESRDIVTSSSTDEGKSSSDKDFSIWLNCSSIDDVVGVGIGEGRINSSSGRDTSNTTHSDTSYRGEGTTKDHLTISLRSEGPDSTTRHDAIGTLTHTCRRHIGDIGTCDTEHSSKKSTDHQYSICTTSKGIDSASCIRIPSSVQHPCRRHSRYTIPCSYSDSSEGSSEYDIVTGVYGESEDIVVGIGIPCCIEYSESRDFCDTIACDSSDGGELSGKDNITSGEELYIPDDIVGIGIEGSIYSSCGEESRGSISRCSCDSSEGSSDEDFAICLECDGIDIVVGVRVEGEIECSVCIESRDTIACDSSYGRKSSSDKDFSICLDGDGSHLVSSCDSDVGIPSSIQCSICIESRDIVTSSSTDEGKSSSDKDLSIWLNCSSIDDVVGVGIGEGRINSSSSRDTSNTTHGDTSYRGEGTTKDDLAISLRSEGPDSGVGIVSTRYISQGECRCPTGIK